MDATEASVLVWMLLKIQDFIQLERDMLGAVERVVVTGRKEVDSRRRHELWRR